MHLTVVQKDVKMVTGDLPAHRIAQYHAFGKRVNKRMEDVFMDAYREDMETCVMNIVIQNAMKRFAFNTCSRGCVQNWTGHSCNSRCFEMKWPHID